MTFWLCLVASPCLFSQGDGSLTEFEEEELHCWIGQMLMVGFRGLELKPDSPFLRQISELKLGGVILFDYDVQRKQRKRNIESPDQVRRLTSALQKEAAVPLFIAVDQEGGKVARLKPDQGFESARSAAELGALDQESVTREQARRMAEMLAGLGINVNFSPVVDLAADSRNPIIAGLGRSFSARPETVIRHARWTIEEFHRQEVISVIKHFPGHGSSREDSHLGLPDVTGSWTPQELEPFARLIEQRLPDMVMTAHLFHDQWDSRLPATLSPGVVNGLLRDRLGFQGVVISDDLGMQAISEHFSLEESIELAIEAGIDILLFGNNWNFDPQIARKSSEVIHGLVQSGRVSPARIFDSYQRIQALKQKYRIAKASNSHCPQSRKQAE